MTYLRWSLSGRLRGYDVEAVLPNSTSPPSPSPSYRVDVLCSRTIIQHKIIIQKIITNVFAERNPHNACLFLILLIVLTVISLQLWHFFIYYQDSSVKKLVTCLVCSILVFYITLCFTF